MQETEKKLYRKLYSHINIEYINTQYSLEKNVKLTALAYARGSVSYSLKL